MSENPAKPNFRQSPEAATDGDCRVTFQPIGRRVTVEPGCTVLEAGRAAGLTLSANCGGIGLCRRCYISVDDGHLASPTETERDAISKEDLDRGIRLACRSRIDGNVAIHVPDAFLGSSQKLQVAGSGRALECANSVRAIAIRPGAIPNPNGISDRTRLFRALAVAGHKADWKTPVKTLANFSDLLRQDTDQSSNPNLELKVFISGSRILGFGNAESRALGLAVDIGCTKVAGYLMDLETGQELAASGIANPQISWGEDLITRLVYATKSPDNAMELAKAVRGAIDGLAARLAEQASVSTDCIVDVSVVGNTAMTHLFLGYPVRQLLHAPFTATSDAAQREDADRLDLTLSSGAQVFVLPSIGGFVGADHVGVLLSQNVGEGSETVLVIDIGTNSEIVLARPSDGKILTTSVPSGPAFEGGHIKDGMRAASGAIEKIDYRDGQLWIKTIDDAQAVGLCGSGVVDLCAALLKTGRINARGALRTDDPDIRQGETGREFVVVPASQSGHGRDITFTQSDIGEIQLVKATIQAGITSLFQIGGIEPDEVDAVILAGAFGTHINLESAVAIGLLPKIPNAAYRQVGNAAGEGACMALLSEPARAHASILAQSAKRCELKEHGEFNRLLARATRFPVPQTSRQLKPKEVK